MTNLRVQNRKKKNKRKENSGKQQQRWPKKINPRRKLKETKAKRYEMKRFKPLKIFDKSLAKSGKIFCEFLIDQHLFIYLNFLWKWYIKSERKRQRQVSVEAFVSHVGEIVQLSDTQMKVNRVLNCVIPPT